ncbi:MAG: hypothetical protein KAR20_07675 [Candidatus Heimdallarchaeota archaeon]|nr:hypothetical protein [Candidatus Heimdallarchaeota archaeon]
MSEKVIEVINSYVQADGKDVSPKNCCKAVWKHGSLIDAKIGQAILSNELMIYFYHELDGTIIEHFGTLRLADVAPFREVERVTVTTYEYKPVEG